VFNTKSYAAPNKEVMLVLRLLFLFLRYPLNVTIYIKEMMAS